MAGVCVIFSGGPVQAPTALRRLIPEGALLVAADSGALLAEAMGVTPHALIGDFDSLPHPPEQMGAGEVIRLPAEKDETDTLAAVRLGMARGCDRFVVLGAFGGRLDHSMANLAVLRMIREQGLDATLHDSETTARMLLGGETAVLEKSEGESFSVFAFGEVCEGLCECGVRYPLHNHTLEPSSSLGQSNQIIEKTAEISLKTGCLLIISAK